MSSLPCGGDTLCGGSPAAALSRSAASRCASGVTRRSVMYASTAVQRGSIILWSVPRLSHATRASLNDQGARVDLRHEDLRLADADRATEVAVRDSGNE